MPIKSVRLLLLLTARNNRMHRKLSFTLLLPVVLLFVAAANGQMASKKAEEQFKNIQVLKGIPAEQLIPTMQFISASLGVECDFCHVQGAFDKDDKKPKQTARKMMEMMFAINKDNFKGRRDVTCYSCHRGNAKPLAIPVVMTEDAKQTSGEPHAPEIIKPVEMPGASSQENTGP